MGMKLHDIYDVMDRFEQSGIARLKLTYDGVELELDRAAAPAAGAAAPIVMAAPAPGMVPPAPVAAPEAAANVASAPEVPVAAPAEEASSSRRHSWARSMQRLRRTRIPTCSRVMR